MMIEVKKFSATWCQPCKILNPMFDRMKTKVDSDVKFTYIDVEEEEELSRQYDVRSVPTVVIEKDGVEMERIIGLQQEIQYLNAINKLK
jgi:thioredoxin 1